MVTIPTLAIVLQEEWLWLGSWTMGRGDWVGFVDGEEREEKNATIYIDQDDVVLMKRKK